PKLAERPQGLVTDDRLRPLVQLPLADPLVRQLGWLGELLVGRPADRELDRPFSQLVGRGSVRRDGLVRRRRGSTERGALGRSAGELAIVPKWSGHVPKSLCDTPRDLDPPVRHDALSQLRPPSGLQSAHDRAAQRARFASDYRAAAEAFD